jgi:hypothetical protein
VKTRKIVIGVGLGVYLVTLGMLAGIAIDRMRFDHHRSDVLGRYERTVKELQAYRMALEKDTAGQR